MAAHPLGLQFGGTLSGGINTFFDQSPSDLNLGEASGLSVPLPPDNPCGAAAGSPERWRCSRFRRHILIDLCVVTSSAAHAADTDAGASGRCCCARVRRHTLALMAYVMASSVPSPAADDATDAYSALHARWKLGSSTAQGGSIYTRCAGLCRLVLLQYALPCW